LFGAWLAGLQPSASFSDPLRLLVVYDPIPLFFGIVALVQLAAIEIGERERTFFNALTFWAIIAFAVYSIGADKNPSCVVVMVVPLAMLAGWYIGVWLERARRETEREFYISQELPVFIFACVIGAFLYLVVAEFVARGSLAATTVVARIIGAERLPGATLDLQIISVLMLIAMAAVGFLIVATVGWRRAPVFVLALVLTALAVWTFRQNAMLNYADALNAREYLVTHAAAANVRDLENDLRDISRWRAGDSTTLSIAADGMLNPIVAWTLRDFRNARFAPRASVTQEPQAFLLAPRAPAPGSGWIRQTYTLENQRAQGGTQNLLRWLLFRDIGALESDSVTLWMRQPE
jgi:hypothetical protein